MPLSCGEKLLGRGVAEFVFLFVFVVVYLPEIGAHGTAVAGCRSRTNFLRQLWERQPGFASRTEARQAHDRVNVGVNGCLCQRDRRLVVSDGLVAQLYCVRNLSARVT